jgi:hypothetical protein
LPRYQRNSVSPVGGTAVETPPSKASPVFALLVALLVGGGIIWFFVNRKHNESSAAPAPTTDTVAGSAVAQPAPSATTPALAPAPAPVQPTVHADQVAKTLEIELKKQRLWSTVAVIGDHVDVRSSSCNDAAMKTTIQPQLAAFHAAGLTKLRCLEQSGAVVFARDL